MKSPETHGFEEIRNNIQTPDFKNWKTSDIAFSIKDKGNPKITAEKVMRYFLERACNDGCNAVIRFNPSALEQAKEIDRRIANNEEVGPLAGVPFFAKDTYETEGIVTACGGDGPTKPLRKNTPTQDAALIVKLKAAGAVLMGKTNTPPAAEDIQCNSHYGRTLNPHRPKNTSGGSSGGCAAAVSQGLAPFSVGSDAAGSGRIPASFCGVTGLKVSRALVDSGQVTDEGHIPPIPPFKPTVEVGSPAILAERPEDIEYILEALGAMDEAPAPQKISVLQSMKGFEPDERTADMMDASVFELKKEGYEILDHSGILNQIDPEDLVQLFGLTFGVQIGRSINSLQDKDVQQRLKGVLKIATKIFGAEKMSSIIRGDYAKKLRKEITKMCERPGMQEDIVIGKAAKAMIMGLENPDKYDEEIAERTEAVRAKIEAVFEEADAIVMPATPFPAFMHRDRFEPISTEYDKRVPYYDSVIVYTVLANLLGLAAGSVPTHKTTPEESPHLPHALQVIAKDESTVLKVMKDVYRTNKKGVIM